MEMAAGKSNMPAGYLIVGALFWCLAFLTFLTALIAYKEQALFSPIAIVYIFLNIIMGYGFLTKSSWITPLLILNFAGILLVSVLRVNGLLPYSSSTRIFITILVSGFLAFYVIKLKSALIIRPLFSFTPLLFIVLWTIGILKILQTYVY